MDSDILCFSHIRWDAGAQRPQQLLSRCASQARVFYFEEPVLAAGPANLLVQPVEGLRLWKATPQLPPDVSPAEQTNLLRQMIEQLIEIHSIHDYILWYYNPAALVYTDRLSPRMVIYDYVSHPGGPEALDFEKKLIHDADLFFVDGQRGCKKGHLFQSGGCLFPGCLDIDHFLEARTLQAKPAGQASVPHPRLGFMGVINDLFDWRLVQAVAEMRPDWHIILIGPMTVDPVSLFQKENVHYLSTREYAELPAYFSGWDVAILPIAYQAARGSIAAIQIPQYLAGGCPVVATSAPEVIRSYRSRGLVWTADTPDQFVQAVEAALEAQKDRDRWLAHIDHCLLEAIWDQVWGWFVQSVEMVSRRQARSLQREWAR